MFENFVHLMILTDNVGEACKFAGLQLQAEKIGNVPKGCQDSDKFTLLISHAGNVQFHPARLAAFGCDGKGRLRVFSRIGHVIRKFASPTAKRMAESLMAVFAQDIFPVVTGNTFGFLVEKKDAPIHVMGNYSFFETVQDMLQVIPMAH
jgi:hypothetical protein